MVFLTDDDEEDEGSAPLSARIGLDANALDPHAKRDEAIARFLTLAARERLDLFIGEGVRAELSRKTPTSDADPLLALVRTKPDAGRPHSAAEHIGRIRVRAILYGNARPEKHAADAIHVSEAAEAGCDYFITYDSRILRKRADLEALAVPTMRIVTLEEFLSLVDRIERRLG